MASYRINLPHVICETIDGESIIVHLQSGNYYSLRGSGPQIWTLLDALADVDRVIDVAAEMYAEPRDRVEDGIQALIAALVAEELIVASDTPAGAPARPPRLDSSAFEPPALTRFDDLREILLADPVQDTPGEWPRQLPNPVGFPQSE